MMLLLWLKNIDIMDEYNYSVQYFNNDPDVINSKKYEH